MEKNIIAIMIFCCMAAGCKSVKKSAENIAVDSVNTNVSTIRSQCYTFDSIGVKGILSVDSIEMKISFDSLGHVKEKKLTLKGVESKKNEKRILKSEESTADSIFSKSAVVMNATKSTAEEKESYTMKWNAMAIFLLMLTALIVYRALRG